LGIAKSLDVVDVIGAEGEVGFAQQVVLGGQFWVSQ
jgi:hypothetical protein